ncbi:hypothetical protein BpHYR1_041963 [Brachionus plicatilis]|uniref:Uncharacterized protein n=1 Tax=Brachionus plicatilis TaxID=10195 RepID=A0A3M7QC70_BRAPC|nr:hypothetical protein BpHYR1_041963 [Brachionus plicatilis]
MTPILSWSRGILFENSCLAKGPTVSAFSNKGIIPSNGVVFKAGLSENMPLKEPGYKTDPEVSVPREITDKPEDTAAPEPKLLGPQLRSESKGFIHSPTISLILLPNASSPRFVLNKIIAP